jgi:tetratricopeptide (TPR) repeat protein
MGLLDLGRPIPSRLRQRRITGGSAIESRAWLPVAEGQILQGLGDLELSEDRSQAAIAWYDQASTIFRTLKDRWLLARTHWGIGRAQIAVGSMESARDHSREALSFFDLLRGGRDAIFVMRGLAAASWRLDE